MKVQSNTIIPLLFVVILNMYAHAQQRRKVDSLTQLLRQYPEKDTSRFKIYGELSWLYATTRSETNTARKYADSINNLAIALNDPRGKALADFYYGAIGRFERNFTAGLRHLNAFVDFHELQGDSSRVATGLFQVAAIYLAMDETEMGLRTLYRALSIHEKEFDVPGTNFVLNAIGTVLKNAGRYTEAIQVYQKVLLTDSTNSDVLMNLGNVFAATGEYEKTLENYRKALSIDRNVEAHWAVAYDLEAIGEHFNKLQKHDSALLYHQQALDIRQGMADKKEKGISLGQLGLTYGYLGQFRRAEILLSEALDIAKEINSQSLKRDTYEKLALIYEKSNDIPKSYSYFKQYTSLKDSLLNEASMKQLHELKTRYETSKKDQQIELLSKENEVSLKEQQRLLTVKNFVVTAIVLLSLLGGLFVYLLFQRMKNQRLLTTKNNEIKEVNFRNQLSELKMKALQAQINPHFIFNCLHSINQMIVEGDNEKASLYLSKFSKLIRLILENSESTEVSLKDEITILEAYVQLEELRFNGNIAYQLNTQRDVDPENTYLPFMVLQPFVENAIWHGLRPKGPNSNGRINISIKQNDGLLICQIEDNGIGRDKSLALQSNTIWKTKSMGLKITEDRLRLLNRELQQQLIRITDLKDSLGNALGTRVEVSIPIL